MFDEITVEALGRLAVETEIEFLETDEPFPGMELSFYVETRTEIPEHVKVVKLYPGVYGEVVFRIDDEEEDGPCILLCVKCSEVRDLVNRVRMVEKKNETGPKFYDPEVVDVERRRWIASHLTDDGFAGWA
jgi:hypothetical protein